MPHAWKEEVLLKVAELSRARRGVQELELELAALIDFERPPLPIVTSKPSTKMDEIRFVLRREFPREIHHAAIARELGHSIESTRTNLAKAARHAAGVAHGPSVGCYRWALPSVIDLRDVRAIDEIASTIRSTTKEEFSEVVT